MKIRLDGRFIEQLLPHRKNFCALGLRMAVRSNDRRLLKLFEHAFGSLPAHTLRSPAPRVDIMLQLEGAGARRRAAPRMRLRSGAGFLASFVDPHNFAIAWPGARRALVRVDAGMLDFPYLLRYDLMEFCVYTLAAKIQQLAPLHGAAVASGGRAVFLSGPAGSGKSTAVVNCAGRLDLVSEDAVFIEPRSLRVAGCANFLHVRTDSLNTVGDARLRSRVRRAPVIRRRSGVRKFELDTRRARLRLAPRAARLAAVVVLSRAKARGGRLLEPLSAAQLRAQLRRAQPYARTQRSWAELSRRIADVPAFRLLRGRRPEDSVTALRSLLDPRT